MKAALKAVVEAAVSDMQTRRRTVSATRALVDLFGKIGVNSLRVTLR